MQEKLRGAQFNMQVIETAAERLKIKSNFRIFDVDQGWVEAEVLKRSA